MTIVTNGYRPCPLYPKIMKFQTTLLYRVARQVWAPLLCEPIRLLPLLLAGFLSLALPSKALHEQIHSPKGPVVPWLCREHHTSSHLPGGPSRMPAIQMGKESHPSEPMWQWRSRIATLEWQTTSGLTLATKSAPAGLVTATVHTFLLLALANVVSSYLSVICWVAFNKA